MRSPLVKPRFGELLDPSAPINQNLVGAWILNEGMGNTIGDSTWYRNPGAATAAPVWTGAVDKVFKGWGPCLTFNGSSQFVQIPHQSYYDATNAFSVELVYLAAANVTSLVFGRGGFGTSTDWGIGQSGTHTIFQLSGTGCSTAASGPGLNVFQHIVGTYDGANIRIYAQGALSNTVAKSGFAYSGSNDFFLGKNPGVTFYNGKVALVRFWAGRALQLQDVEQLYVEPYAGWLPSTVGRLWFQFGTPGRTTQGVQAKANIRATTDQSVQARANVRGVTAHTVQVRANITNRQQKTGQAKANIRLPLPNTGGSVYQVVSWSVEDDLTSLCRSFNVRLKGKADLQVGSPITIKGGYDNNNVTLVTGIVDEVTLDTTPNSLETIIQGRDSGAREFQSIRTTFTVPSEPPLAMPLAKGVIGSAVGITGLTIGSLDFLDYSLFATYTAIGHTAPEVIAELVQPFNQFPSQQYHTRLVNRLVSVLAVNYNRVTGTGGMISVPRSLQYRMQRRQLLYLDQPRLNEIQQIVIRGAAYTIPKTNLGTVTKNEYFRTTAMQEVAQGVQGQVIAPGESVQTGANSGAYQEVVTEISTSTTVYGDKLLNSREEVVVNGALSVETLERYWYTEPGSINGGGGPVALDAASLVNQSLNPSESALLFMTSIIRSGLVDTGNGIIFQQVERSVRQCFYDSANNLACEATTTEQFDTTLLQWKITEMNVRTHAEATSGAVRTQLLNLQFSGTQFEFGSADTQVVAGGRPNTTQRGSRRSVITVQAQSPFGELDGQGNAIDPGTGLFTWSYESPYLGQSMCDVVFGNALDEKVLQQTNPRWEQIDLECPLLPMVYAGQLLEVEVAPSVFLNYILDTVAHQYEANQAATRLSGRRITTDSL